MLLRAREKLEAMAKSAEKLYERIADALAKTSTSQLDASTPELLVNHSPYLPTPCICLV